MTVLTPHSGPLAQPSATQVTRTLIFAIASTIVGVGVIGFEWSLMTTALVALAPASLLLLLPGGSALTPWRVFLPALIAYNGIALLIEQPGTVDQQLDLMLRFSVGFMAGAAASYLVPVWVPQGGRRADQFVVNASALRLLTWAGIAGMLYLFAVQGGPPILAANPAAARVALADQAVVYVAAQVFLELVIVVDLLRLRGIALVDADRPRYAYVLVALALLFSTAGRSHFLIPLAMVVFCLIMSGWRRFTAAVTLGAVAAGAFLLVGAFRGGTLGQAELMKPATDYMRGTVQEANLALRTFPSKRDFYEGDLFFWMYHRISNPSAPVEPPGIVLRDVFDRTGTFEGFGLEPGIITAWYVDWGANGVLVGGLIVGLVSNHFYRRWRIRGGWSMLVYAYILVWLMLSIAIHPVASYFFLFMPLALTALWWTSRQLAPDYGSVSP